MRGYGDPAGETPTATTPATATTWFGWGWGDPDPDTLHAAASSGLTWSGAEIEWGYGDEAYLEAAHILVVSSQRQPDDGGEIVELRAEWPSIGPWRIRLVQRFTGATFPQADAPSLYVNSPQPGQGIDVETNRVEVEEAGELVTKPGTRLRFVLPPLPPGAYSVRIEAPPPALLGSELTVEGALEIIHRGRPLEVYTHRRRYPEPYSVGVRELTAEPLLGLHPDADGDEGAP